MKFVSETFGGAHAKLNINNDFTFAYMGDGRNDVPSRLKELGVGAVQALEMDFGMADVILGKDGRYYVLEVNSAGEAEKTRVGLKRLARKVVEWERGGCRAH